MEEEGISKTLAVTSCTAMAVFYVAILYSPTLILRLPPPDTFKTYLIRRFICAAVSSLISLIVCALILLIRSWNVSDISSVYGIRLDHMWPAFLNPLLLTSLMYTGSFTIKLKLMLNSWAEQRNFSQDHSSTCGDFLQIFITYLSSMVSNVSAWRKYVVAPLTEELVFRACMIPLLLCGGFGTYTVMFFCPIFFSLAHLNHFLEICTQQNHNLLKASMVIGLQLSYTVVFGSYASFFFIRTGHLLPPLVAHVFCNFMGLPVLYAPRNGIVTLAFVGGVLGFVLLLFPATYPGFYNDKMDGCSCWQRFCSWN